MKIFIIERKVRNMNECCCCSVGVQQNVLLYPLCSEGLVAPITFPCSFSTGPAIEKV